MLSTQNGTRSPWMTAAALIVATGLVAGCQSSGSSSQKQSSALADTMKKYGDEASKAITDLDATLDAHNTLVNEPTGDLVAVYAVFSKGVKTCAKSHDNMEKTSTKMAELAAVRFDEWEATIEGFSSESMAKRSQKQLDTTREKFDAVVSAGEKTMEAYAPLLSLLQDHELYLSTDLSPASAAALQDDDKKLGKMKKKLVEGIEELVEAATTFREATAMSVPEPETPADG